MTATIAPPAAPPEDPAGHAPRADLVMTKAGYLGYRPACACGGCFEVFGHHDDEQSALDEARDLIQWLNHGPDWDLPVDYWPTTPAERAASAFALKMELNS